MFCITHELDSSNQLQVSHRNAHDSEEVAESQTNAVVFLTGRLVLELSIWEGEVLLELAWNVRVLQTNDSNHEGEEQTLDEVEGHKGLQVQNDDTQHGNNRRKSLEDLEEVEGPSNCKDGHQAHKHLADNLVR